MPTRSSLVTALEVALQNWLEDVVRRVVREELDRHRHPTPSTAQAPAERGFTDEENAGLDDEKVARIAARIRGDDNCGTCTHLPIMHADRKGRCRARNCKCERWVPKSVQRT